MKYVVRAETEGETRIHSELLPYIGSIRHKYVRAAVTPPPTDSLFTQCILWSIHTHTLTTNVLLWLPFSLYQLFLLQVSTLLLGKDECALCTLVAESVDEIE